MFVQYLPEERKAISPGDPIGQGRAATDVKKFARLSTCGNLREIAGRIEELSIHKGPQPLVNIRNILTPTKR